MKQNSVIAISKSLHITRARVYQIIRKLEKQGKISKDKDGKYILNARAVNEIEKVYNDTGKMSSYQTKLVKSQKKSQELDRKVLQLQSQMDSMKKLIDQYQKTIEAKDQTILALQANAKNVDKYQKSMDSAISVLKESADNMKREQSLHYMDKTKEISAPAKEKESKRKQPERREDQRKSDSEQKPLADQLKEKFSRFFKH